MNLAKIAATVVVLTLVIQQSGLVGMAQSIELTVEVMEAVREE